MHAVFKQSTFTEHVTILLSQKVVQSAPTTAICKLNTLSKRLIISISRGTIAARSGS